MDGLALTNSSKNIIPKLESFTTIIDPIKSYAIFTMDLDGNITSWNEGAVNIYGYKKKEAVGKHFSFLYLPLDVKKNKPSKDLASSYKNCSYESDDNLLKKNGDIFLANISIAPITDANNKHVGYIEVLKDITVQHQHEADQLGANSLLKQEIDRRKVIEKDLKESNAELEAFASAASHDLQEPLRMVISYLQLIDRRYRDKLDKDGREFLEFAVDGASRMRTLISDLVEYSRVDMAAKPYKLVNTNEVVEQVINNLQLSAQDAGVKIIKDNLPNVWGDAVQLSQVFQNLIANAIKFHGDKSPEVHIGYQQKDTEYIFSIKDNGKGINKKDYQKIFLIFKQLGSRTIREGSGIGLAVTKKIVKRHNGRIWVESTENVGSTFYFTIPIHQLKRRR